MSHRRQMRTAWLLVISVAVSFAAADERAAHFGKQWVRSHPFTLMALTQRPEAVLDDKYREAGLNTMLAWKPRDGLFEAAVRQGLPWHFNVNKRNERLTDELKAQIDGLMTRFEGGAGFLVFDEPKLLEMARAGEVAAWIKATYPDVLVYSDAYPIAGGAKLCGGEWLASGLYDEPSVPYSYDDYLADFTRLIRPDILMFDIYPFPQPPEADPEEYLAGKYFAAMSAIRKAALKAGIPYWVFVQAYEKEGGGGRRLPSESDLRTQMFTSLAYGFTGMAYFTYDAAFMRGLLEQDFSPSRLYATAQQVNAEVLNLGQALRFLTSTDVRYIVGKHDEGGELVDNPVPEGLGIYHERSRVAKEVTGIALSETGIKRNGLIGFFQDDAGGSYFMPVNMCQGQDASAADCTTTFTLSLAPSVTDLYRLSRETGQPEKVDLQDGTLTVTLPGGTGDLFKTGDGRFPGLEP